MELSALKVGKPRPTPVVRGGITAVFDYGENTLKKKVMAIVGYKNVHTSALDMTDI